MSVARITPPPDVALAARFRDQSRFRSREVKHAFGSVMRVSKCPQSEVTRPDEATLEADLATSDKEIVRGVD